MSNNKKVLLVTMQDNNNIGNRLQNYALQYVLGQYGAKVTNLDNGYNDYHIGKKQILKNAVQRTLAALGLTKYKIKVQNYENWRIRHFVNKKFSDNRIHNITRVTVDDVYQRDWKAYDLAIVGSDQVWHKWSDSEKELPYYYLSFLPKEKRNSYAASFGFDEFPDPDRSQHVKGIKGMNNISCRESTGCKLVKDVIGKDVPHVLDPTLLLSADDWHKMTTNANDYAKSQKGYAFMYFLGKKTPEYEAEIQHVLKENKLKTIDFLDFSNSDIAKCGPEEFISLIEHADYVLTDSFHCCVFSILFNKKFEVFRRKGEGMEKMFSRIEELLLNTGHSDNAFGGLNPQLKPENFSELRQTSLNYLEKVLTHEV